FFLRSFSNLSNKGALGLIASNSIAEGGTREVGLEQLKNKGAIIYSARNAEAWPGSANVVTSRVHIYKGAWSNERRLNACLVDYISPYLTSRDNWEPVKLQSNGGLVHQGNVTL